MIPPLLNLPEDILIGVYAHISVQDLLCLNQVCRVLHAFGSTDYIWHHIKLDLPLDISPNSDINSIPGPQLRDVAVRALRLERKWRGTGTGVIKKLTHGTRSHPYSDAISQMRLLPGGRWLVTLTSKGIATPLMVVWDLRSKPMMRLASFEIPGGSRCSAAIQEGGSEVIIAVLVGLSKKESLHLYTVPLNGMSNGHHGIPRLYGIIPRPGDQGSFHEVHASGHIVAATIATFVGLSPPSYQILFINTSTGAQVIVQVPIPEGVTGLGIRLYVRHIAITIEMNSRSLLVRIYDLPPSMNLNEKRRTITWSQKLAELSELGLPIREYQTRQMMRSFDYHLSENAELCSTTLDSARLSFISFNSHSENAYDPGVGYIYTTELDFSPCVLDTDSKSDSPPAQRIQGHKFSTTADTAVGYVCVGTSGRRAVWLQRNWDTDEFRLMKLSFSRDEIQPQAKPLIPKYLALPFLTQACQALAFDEVTGRVCIGLDTGDIYVLDFQ